MDILCTGHASSPVQVQRHRTPPPICGSRRTRTFAPRCRLR